MQYIYINRKNAGFFRKTYHIPHASPQMRLTSVYHLSQAAQNLQQSECQRKANTGLKRKHKQQCQVTAFSYHGHSVQPTGGMPNLFISCQFDRRLTEKETVVLLRQQRHQRKVCHNWPSDFFWEACYGVLIALHCQKEQCPSRLCIKTITISFLIMQLI